MWNIQEAIGVARILEPIAVKQGYHVALGGSVLRDGVSQKDVDIFFYRHTTKKNECSVICRDPDTVVQSLSEIGFQMPDELLPEVTQPASVSEHPYKRVFRLAFMSKRVDIIFLLPTDNAHPN